MTKVTEQFVSGGQDVSKSFSEFTVVAKGFVRQDSIHDFVASHSEGEFIALSGSKSDIVTLELTSKFEVVDSFPYIVANLELDVLEPRPLDVLANQVNLEAVYDSCNILEAQHLALDPVYTAVCSVSVPETRLISVKRAPKLLPNGNLLLGSLNSYGSLSLMTKPAESNRWSRLEGLNVSVTLRDTLLPKTDVSEITNFKKYQAFINPPWITMFAWLPDDSESIGQHVLILGTASGSLWKLTISPDFQTLLSHQQMKTSLGRICYIHAFKNLLLVGDIDGLIHLYTISTDEESSLILTKALWGKADRMGLQMGLITECPDNNCCYITCCKAAHLLTWSMPRSGDKEWLESRLYVGGMKITGLCSLDKNWYAVGTLSSHLQRVQITHEGNQLTLQMDSIPMDVLRDFSVMGLCISRHKNLMTMLLYRNKEYMNQTVDQRKQLVIQVVKVGDQNALPQLANRLKLSQPITTYTDLLAEVKLHIFAEENWEKYTGFSPLDSFKFNEAATESQLQQLQLKFHVLQSVLCVQSSHLHLTVHVKKTQDEMQLLLAMISITHMRLRLQFVGSLGQRSPFQEQASKCLFEEAQRVLNKLKADFTEEHPLNSTTKAFVQECETHFQALHINHGNIEICNSSEQEDKKLRCCISFVEISPSLERRYCSLCERPILFELESLQELYEPGGKPTCPICRGSFAVEMFTA
ncbi:uncharacterized protein LOC108099102 [Drosophila ficusphila]|uniref:uncharacterized protein LOC108099102 n=1 Tax=Drosophila ficusphila TaxID=30025 RepID=UPI0007E88090|nr:uncharacterized protein LOC108099102 [Drosophila ficusphila]